MGQYLADGQFYDFHDSAPIQFSEIHAEIEGGGVIFLGDRLREVRT